MTDISRDAVLAALKSIRDPQTGDDIVSRGMVQGLVVRDGRVGFAIELPATITPDAAAQYEPLREAAEAVVREIGRAHV